MLIIFVSVISVVVICPLMGCCGTPCLILSATVCQPQLRDEAPDDVDTALLTLATAVIQDVRKASDPGC